MERRTIKVGITGKYGTRYGQKLRKQVKAIEILQRTTYTCPFCGKNSIKREAVGIWRCRACRRNMAGGAWEFSTIAAQTAKTTINRLKKVTSEVKKAPEEEMQVEEEVKKTDKKPKTQAKEGDKKDRPKKERLPRKEGEERKERKPRQEKKEGEEKKERPQKKEGEEKKERKERPEKKK